MRDDGEQVVPIGEDVGLAGGEDVVVVFVDQLFGGVGIAKRLVKLDKLGDKVDVFLPLLV